MRHRKAFAVLSLVLAVGGMCLAGAGCKGRPRKGAFSPVASASVGTPAEAPDLSSPHVAELDLTGGLAELSSSSLLSPSKHRSFSDLVLTLAEIQTRRDENIHGVLLRFGGIRLGMARAQELALALGAVRKAGLSVVCQAEELNNGTAWVAASGCDRIWLSPAGGLDTVGIAAQVVYAKKLLGDLKVDVDMLQVGRFKGASEPLTREGPSPEARESLVAVLRSIRSSWLSGIEKSRNFGDKKNFAEQGPYSPQEAKGLGLVDEIGYADEAQANAKSIASVNQSVVRFGRGAVSSESSGLVDLVRVVSGAGAMGDVPHVSVIRAAGSITMESSGVLKGDGDGISEREFTRVVRRAKNDESVRSVVLRIDSPGGSALASDLMWRELMELRRVKPLIVSVGDMAASGGYYLSCAGSRIFAEPTSIVGSIGVVGGKFSFSRGMEHVGVHAETFAASDAPGAEDRAAYLSPLRGWDDATRGRMLVTMTSVYDLFLNRVSEGRKIPKDRVEGFAEGRIFSGQDGLALGMVDELGGLGSAIDYARRVAGLESDAPVRLVGDESGLERLLAMDGDGMDEETRAAMQERATLRLVFGHSAPELLGFMASLEPMLRGERALVAVPFAMLIR